MSLRFWNEILEERGIQLSKQKTKVMIMGNGQEETIIQIEDKKIDQREFKIMKQKQDRNSDEIIPRNEWK